MPTDEELLAELVKELIDLFNGLQGKSHGVFQGTHEAVLLEGQGGQLGPDGYSHMTDLIATRDMIAKRELALTNTLGRINGISPYVGSRLKDLLQPILSWSSEARATMTRTKEMAELLKQTDGKRFAGVTFGEGGMGPEVGRTARALVSSQIQRRAAELEARGIEPRLIPAIRTGAQELVTKIRNLPISKDEAIQKLAGVLATMRTILSQFARQAAAAGRVALQAALASIEAALVALSSRFTTLPIIFLPGRLEDLLDELWGIDRKLS